MPAIADAARAAHRAQKRREAAFERDLRSAVLDVTGRALAAFTAGAVQPTQLKVQHVDLDELLTVYSDGTVHLAVLDDGRVHLVKPDPDDPAGWTFLGEPLSDLADLHVRLSEG